MRKEYLILFLCLISYLQIYGAIWPVPLSYNIGGAYGDYRNDITYGFHAGIDIEASQGDPVYAVDGGKVDYIWIDRDQLRILTSSGICHIYAHVQNIFVAVDQPINSGDVIAEVGPFDGTYSHLDFSLENNQRLTIDNPLSIFSVTDAISPTVESIFFRDHNDKTKYFEDKSLNYPDAVKIWGKVDIISKASDIIGEVASKKPGIYKIGYQIPEVPSGVTPITTTQWLVEFSGALPFKNQLGIWKGSLVIP